MTSFWKPTRKPWIKKGFVNHLFKDSDKDGVPNVFDCRPFDPRHQDRRRNKQIVTKESFSDHHGIKYKDEHRYGKGGYANRTVTIDPGHRWGRENIEKINLATGEVTEHIPNPDDRLEHVYSVGRRRGGKWFKTEVSRHVKTGKYSKPFRHTDVSNAQKLKEFKEDIKAEIQHSGATIEEGEEE